MRGHIVRPTKKNGRKTWTLVISRRDPQSGKQSQKWYSSFSTRAAAEAFRAQLLTAMRGGTYIPEDDTPFGDYLEQWLRDYAENRVGPVTLRDYRAIVALHLESAFGKDPLRGISAQDIDRYCGAKMRDGLSPNTVLKHYRCCTPPWSRRSAGADSPATPRIWRVRQRPLHSRRGRGTRRKCASASAKRRSRSTTLSS